MGISEFVEDIRILGADLRDNGLGVLNLSLDILQDDSGSRNLVDSNDLELKVRRDRMDDFPIQSVVRL